MESIKTLQEWLGTGAINIFGRQFAGKDTQGEKLLDVLGGSMLGGGDILRNSIIPDNVNETMLRGELVPIEDYISIVLPYLAKDEFSGKPLILSSVGRWKGEEAGVIEALHQANHELKVAIYLHIPEEEARNRWRALQHKNNRGNRADDTLEALNTRLDEYRKKTLPVIDEYEKLGLLMRIDGTGSQESVHQDILEGLLKLARK